ncbi:MAG: cation transporter [Planctomycetes bacterium]|nr:cation transporter [Planctomycetota bacterium]
MAEVSRTVSLLLSPRAVTWTGLVVNVLLAAAKLIAGAVFGSQAIFADGLHSGSDMVTDLAVLAGLRASQRPADRTHHFGHRRIGTLVAMFVGAALMLAAGGVAFRAVVSLHGPAARERSLLPLALAVATIPVKELLYRMSRYAGRKAGELSLLANAWHHRGDALSSLAAAAGLTVVAVGGPSWAYMDAVTAVALSGLLAGVAWKIIHRSADELTDRAPGAVVMKAIERAVAATPGVQGFHAVRARRLGGLISTDVHVLVDPTLTVRRGHDIASAVQESIRDTVGNVIDVNVHVEPYEPDGTEPA